MITMQDIEKELKELEMIVPDGKLKGCLVYHESIKDFFRSQLIKVLDEMEKEMPRLRKLRLDKLTIDVGWNEALVEVKSRQQAFRDKFFK